MRLRRVGTNNMNYELAKKLKDAGFPQEGDGSVRWTDQEPNLGIPVYQPTLSELIEACGDKFEFMGKGDPVSEWIAFDNGELNGRGSTPEIAVANLYLALNTK